jgi:hypothetical protein
MQTAQYPRPMADQTPAPEKPPGEGPPGEPSAAAERYGVVAVSRSRKDDGRNLLLYTREEPGGE